MKKHHPAFVQLVQSVMNDVTEITVPQLLELQKSNQPFVLIDVREDHEWQKNHIPDAIHLSKGIIERDIEEVVPEKATMIVLYCGGGFRSALAASNLKKMGYSDVLSLAGGYRGWQQSHAYPL